MEVGSAIRVGFIGDGGISRAVRECLTADDRVSYEVSCILTRDTSDDGSAEKLTDLISSRPDIIVECAGHGAVHMFGEAILRAGIDFMIVSIGSLADPSLFERLRSAATEGSARLILAPGAIAGIDALAAANLGGLDRVRYTGRKPPKAWRGTEAEGRFDLEALDAPVSLYSGSAREAALRYPANSNVAATIALAGLGFDRTEVQPVADPSIVRNVHELMFEGGDGSVEIRVCGAPSLANPKTSALTAHSIARLLRGLTSPIVI